jgi:transposase
MTTLTLQIVKLRRHRRAHDEARRQVTETRKVLHAAVIRAVGEGLSEAEAARVAGVDRMTVRKWLGK